MLPLLEYTWVLRSPWFLAFCAVGVTQCVVLVFALYLGITPPAPGQEFVYAALLLGVTLLLLACGYFIVHFLMGQMLG